MYLPVGTGWNNKGTNGAGNSGRRTCDTPSCACAERGIMGDRVLSGYRTEILGVAAVLVLWCLPPVRRRLPGLRRLPGSLELALWIGLVVLCLAALGAVQTHRSSELTVATLRAGLNLAGQAFDGLLGPSIAWASGHEPGLALLTAGTVLATWLAVAYALTRAVARAREPRPRLHDWWVVKSGRRGSARQQSRQIATAARQAEVMDSRTAALYVGVSRATLYRWVRAGQLPCVRDGSRLQFRSSDLARMRVRMRGDGDIVATGATR